MLAIANCVLISVATGVTVTNLQAWVYKAGLREIDMRERRNGRLHAQATKPGRAVTAKRRSWTLVAPNSPSGENRHPGVKTVAHQIHSR